MTPEQTTAFTKRLPKSVQAAIHRIASERGIAVHVAIDAAMGRPLYGSWAPDSMGDVAERVRDAIGLNHLDGGHNGYMSWWPETPAPEWLVMVAGGICHDVDALAEVMKRHLRDQDLPARVQIGEATWICARHHGTRGDMQDITDETKRAEIAMAVGPLVTLAPRQQRESIKPVTKEQLVEALRDEMMASHLLDERDYFSNYVALNQLADALLAKFTITVTKPIAS